MGYDPNAELVGIGIFLAPNRSGQFMITKISPDGAAFRTQQIQVGDLLVQVDDSVLDGMQIDEVRRCITGPPNSDIYLSLLRPLMNAETGYEELNPIHVHMKRERSMPSHNSFPERDFTSTEFDGQQNVYSADGGSRMPNEPIVGQAFSQFTPSTFQARNDPAAALDQRRAPSLLTPQPYPQRRHQLSPIRAAPGPALRGGISANGVLLDPSRISTASPPHLRPAAAVAGIYGSEPSQYGAVRRSISAPEPRRSWPQSSDAWDQQQPGPALAPPRQMTPQATAAPQGRRRGMSPGAPGIGLFGIGVVLQNDAYGELRVIDITPGGPADVQGCPFKPGDTVIAIDGRNVRGLPALQARELVLGRHGTPVQVQVLRSAVGAGMRGSGPNTVFQPLTYVMYRGVNNRVPAAAPGAISSRTSGSVRTPSPFRPSPGAVAPGPMVNAGMQQQKQFGVNEHMCGIGVFIERVRGSLLVKSINPSGPAGQVPPTYLFPGDHLVAIDGKNTQSMTMQEVRNQIIGKRGTYVTLSLRRFLPSTGDLSHVFETRVQRDLHPAPVSPGHATREDQSAGSRQGPMIGLPHDNAPVGEVRGTAQPFIPDNAAASPNGVGTIGIQLMEIDQVLMVRELDRGGPAERCGLISIGDVLHRIDYQKVDGLSVEDVQGMLSGPARSSVVLGFVKFRLHLRVNIRLSRETFEAQAAPRRTSPLRAKPGDPYAIPRQESPYRARPSLDHYTTIYTSIEQPRAMEQPRVVEPQRMAVGMAGMATPRLLNIRPNMQFSGGFAERLRRPTPTMQHPFMFSPYPSSGMPMGNGMVMGNGMIMGNGMALGRQMALGSFLL